MSAVENFKSNDSGECAKLFCIRHRSRNWVDTIRPMILIDRVGRVAKLKIWHLTGTVSAMYEE